MGTTVWAFQPLPELKGDTGFVACDDALAARLLAAGEVQDPRIGATALKEITNKPPVRAAAAKPAPPPPPPKSDDEDERDYDTKILTAKKPSKK